MIQYILLKRTSVLYLRHSSDMTESWWLNVNTQTIKICIKKLKY